MSNIKPVHAPDPPPGFWPMSGRFPRKVSAENRMRAALDAIKAGTAPDGIYPNTALHILACEGLKVTP